MNRIGNFINGKKSLSKSNKFDNVFDPSTGEIKSEVNLSNYDDLEYCIKAAKKSQIEWSEITPLKRSRILQKYKLILEENIDELAKLVSSEHGKTIEDAKGSVTRGIEVVEFASGIPHLIKGEFSQNVGTDIDSWSIRQPLGICAGITPFNFPAMVPMWMYPIAIACGNSFILKPSEKDPSCPMKLAELFSEAGLPDGIFNVINGNKDLVNHLLSNNDISSISFVGSTNVAKYIYEQGGKYHKRVQALGGAKNHLVVMPDADLDQAVDGIIGAGYGSAGERCMAVSAVVAVGDISNELVKKIADKAEKINVGPWTDNNSNMGPLISEDHKKKVINYIETGIDEGADLILDGRNIKLQGYENGFFVGPTLFDNVNKNMTIYKDEIFGPVLSVLRVPNYDSAIELINDHEYGNGTSIYTSSGDIARHFSSNIKIGMVGINVPIPVPMAFHTFGGWKNSLFGSSGMHGIEGMNFYSKQKTVTSRWPSTIKRGSEFKIPTN